MIGSTLSHYKILEELGRGGMGIVYKAEDTKLDRIVAVKVLPSATLASENVRARFFREAKAAARLNHPNIAGIHEIDAALPSGAPHGTEPSPFIAMEFIDGESLDTRIEKGPLPLDDAVRITKEVASALDTAHENNIVHRDIKSQNIMLTTTGSAKILDFGLAQTNQSTILTREGTTLGTVSYMSPEQARGEEVDRRSDLWSLGVVLYEMISGKHPFPGEYEQAVVYEILNQDPEPLTALRTDVPLELERIALKCLMKDTAIRYQHADDLSADLKALELGASKTQISSSGDIAATKDHDFSGTQKIGDGKRSATIATVRAAWPLLLAVTALSLVLSYLLFQLDNRSSLTIRTQKLPIHLEGITSVLDPAVSPHSKYISFSGTDTLSRNGLFLFDTETAEISYLEGSGGASQARFSPDGSRLAYIRGRRVYVVTVPSGAPNMINESALSVIWETPNTLLFHDMNVNGMMRVNIHTRDLSEVVVPDSTEQLYEYWIDNIVPGEHIGIGTRALDFGLDPSLLIVDLKSGEFRYTEEGVFCPSFLRSGHLVYQIGNHLLSPAPVVISPFDIRSGVFSGPPEPVLSDVDCRNQFLGEDGSYVYTSDLVGFESGRQSLFIVDLANQSVRVVNESLSEEEHVTRPSFSPDGKSVAVHFENDNLGMRYVSVLDLESETYSRRTFGESRRDPAWSADGEFLYYDGYRSQTLGIYRQSLTTPGDETTVVTGLAYNPALSPNGKQLAYSDDDDIWIFDLDSSTRTVFESSPGSQVYPEFSPDGRFISFDDNVTNSIIVRSITGPGRSTGSGRSILTDSAKAKWAPDGSSIYFISEQFLYRIPISTDPVFQVTGDAVKVARILGRNWTRFFDISPDGNLIVVTGAGVDLDIGTQSNQYSTLMWWQNWAQSMEKE